MLRTKDKMYLRSLANHLKPVFQVGKDGVNENMMKDILLYLNKHELMKVRLLETAPNSKDEVSYIFHNYGIEVVMIIGRTFVIYKHSDNAEDSIVFN